MPSFRVTTSAQVERTYEVEGRDEEHARKRLRTFLADPDLLREGLVVPQPDAQQNTTPEKINRVAEFSAPKPVEQPGETPPPGNQRKAAAS